MTKFRHRRVATALGLAGVLAVTPVVASGAGAAVPSWYSDAATGIILTWGLNTGALPFTACDGNNSTLPIESAAAWESNLTSIGWDPNDWVAAAQKLHADYIVLSTFHSLQGYLRPYPSAVPGSPKTTHDYYADLMTAAEAAGIQVVIYVTSDPQWANDNGCDWLDSAAYNSWKGGGANWDLDNENTAGFGNFSYDVVKEMIARYGNRIDGFWFDGWANGWTSLGMNNYIRTNLPNAVIIANDFFSFPSWGEDVIAVEDIAKDEQPAYDYPSATWNRQNEAEGVYAPAGWDYFATNTVPMRSTAQFEIKWLASIAGTGWPALMGLPTKMDGTFESDVNAQLSTIDDFLDWADPALGTTVAGGYDFGIQPGEWSDGSYGFVTSNATGTTQYLHVVQAPVGAVTKSSSGSWVSPTELNGHEIGAVTISGDTSGNLWVVDTLDRIWRKSGGSWAQMPGYARDLATGSDGSVWTIQTNETGDPNGFAHKWNTTTNTWDLFVNSNGNGLPGTKIAVDGSGRPWVVQKSGTVVQYDGSSFVSQGTGQDVANGPSGQIWKIGPSTGGSVNGEVYEWNGSSFVNRFGGGIQLAVDSTGAPWLTNSFGDVHKRTGGTWVGQNLAASGISTTLGGTVYKHAPAPTTISMPDSGWAVSAAQDLRGGGSLTQSQTGGVLSVTVADWSTVADYGDQIIKLTATASSRIYARSSLTATASANAGGPASNAVDAVDTSAWNLTSGFPAWIKVQTATSQTITGLRIAQQEFAPIITNPGDGNSWKIRNATIEVSTNNSTWTTVWTGELKNQRGGQTINFAPTTGSYVRLTITSNWANDGWAAIQSLDVLKQ